MANSRSMTYKFDAKIASSFNSNMSRYYSSLQKSTGYLNQVARSQRSVTQNSHKMTSSMNNMLKGITGLAAGYLSLSALVAGYKSVTGAADESNRAQQRLQTLMSNVKGTRQKDIIEIQRYAAALQRTSVIEDDTAIAGASQLATYQLKASSIKKLMPALEDLAVGQFGVNVSQEQIINSSNLLGKVFTGQAGALRRAGVSFSKAQEAILKHGNETQKTATLVKVLQENYGGLARAMAQTPEGKVVQLKNAWGDIQETIGGMILPLRTQFIGYLNSNLPQIQSSVQAMFSNISSWWAKNKSIFIELWHQITRAYDAAKPAIDWLINTGGPNTVTALTEVFRNVVQIERYFADNWKTIGPIITGITVYMAAFKAITMGTQAAIWLLNAASTAMAVIQGIVAKAQGVMLLLQYATKGAVGMQLILNATMGAMPVAVIAAAVAALTLMGIKLYEMNEQTKELINQAKQVDEHTAKMSSHITTRTDNAFTATGADRAAIRKEVIAKYHLGKNANPGIVSMYELSYLKHQKKYKEAGNPRYIPNTAPVPVKHHAYGGLVRQQTLSWLAEKNKPELVLPLSNQPRTQQLLQSNGLGGGLTANIHITVNGGGNSSDIAQATKEAVKRALNDVIHDQRRKAYA